MHPLPVLVFSLLSVMATHTYICLNGLICSICHSIQAALANMNEDPEVSVLFLLHPFGYIQHLESVLHSWNTFFSLLSRYSTPSVPFAGTPSSRFQLPILKPNTIKSHPYYIYLLSTYTLRAGASKKYLIFTSNPDVSSQWVDLPSIKICQPKT